LAGGRIGATAIFALGGAMAYDEVLANRLREALRGEKNVTEKKMFGGLAFLINGNMAVAAGRQGGLLLRCDPKETGTVIRPPHAERLVIRGREMNGWLRVDQPAFTTQLQLEHWVKLGVDYARSLPPKRA
jgi:TfoX/Sxy family transcriptional regulator of competence genes